MKIWSLYLITNRVNNKVYIGQASSLTKRWSDHKAAVQHDRPTQPIHHAMIKYGLDNFVFQHIASCLSLDDANYIETELVKQYDSFIDNGKGYNATLGGMNAPKSDSWRAHMSTVMKPISQKRMANETPEEKVARYLKVSNTMKGMKKIPGSGRKKGSTGQISSNRKFSKEQIDSIIQHSKNGMTSRDIAKLYNVHRSTISRIVSGTNYKN